MTARDLKIYRDKTGTYYILDVNKRLIKYLEDNNIAIIDIAEKNDIVMVENKPLARALYDAVEVNREIPVEYYHAVAEVLTFVYGVKGKIPGKTPADYY